MKKSLYMSALALALALSFSGCSDTGGDDATDDNASSSSTGSATVTIGTGYYLDSAVSGADYTCGSQSGTTGNDGSFQFEAGQLCNFSLAGIQLRNVSADQLQDGVRVIEDNASVAAFLQSIDVDGDPTNGISVTAEVKTALQTLAQQQNLTNVPDASTLQVIVSTLQNTIPTFSGQVVSEQDALAHVAQTYTQTLQAQMIGKTLYEVAIESDGNITRETLTFTQTTLEGVDENGNTWSEPYTISGNKITFPNDNNSYVIVTNVNMMYVTAGAFAADGTFRSSLRLFYTQADADAYYNALTGSTTPTSTVNAASLIGKAAYSSYAEADSSGVMYTYYDKITFGNTECTYSEIKVDSSGAQVDSVSVSFPCTYSGDTVYGDTSALTIADAPDKMELKIIEIQPDYIVTIYTEYNNGVKSSEGASQQYLYKPSGYPSSL